MHERQYFRICRERKKVNTMQMAQDLDITESHLRGIEKGRNNPTLKLAFRISSYLDAPIEALFSDLAQ